MVREGIAVFDFALQSGAGSSLFWPAEEGGQYVDLGLQWWGPP